MIVTILLSALLTGSLALAVGSLRSGADAEARRRRDVRPAATLFATAAGAGVLLVGWVGADGDLDSPVVAAALLVAGAIAALVRVGPLGDGRGGGAVDDDEPR
jgi:hypothetical protein